MTSCVLQPFTPTVTITNTHHRPNLHSYHNYNLTIALILIPNQILNPNIHPPSVGTLKCPHKNKLSTPLSLSLSYTNTHSLTHCRLPHYLFAPFCLVAMLLQILTYIVSTPLPKLFAALCCCALPLPGLCHLTVSFLL